MGYEAKYFDAGQPTPAGCHDCKNQIHGCWRQSVTAASLERGRGLAGSCIGSRRRGGTVHHVFQFLARLEIRDLLGRHLDARAGLRIASDARLALPCAETAETANLDLVAGAQRTHDTVKNDLYDDLGFFPRLLDYARDLFNQTGLGHVLFSLSSQAVTAVSPERAIFAGYSALRFLRLSTSLMVAVACGLRRRLRLWKPATRTRATDYTCRFQRHRQELRTRKFRAFPPLVLRCSSGRPRASARSSVSP